LVVDTGHSSLAAWHAELVARGASVADGCVLGFGDARAELAAARDSAIVCDLSHRGLVAFTGADAQAFLHGQLSSDLAALGPDACQLSTYNTPQGRAAATLLLWRGADGFLADLPGVLTEAVRRKLSMYILRSKARAIDASAAYIRLGVGGPQAAQALGKLGICVPTADFAVVQNAKASLSGAPANIDWLLRLPGGRIGMLLAESGDAIRLLDSLIPHARTAGADAWNWLGVRSGIPEILPQTQDAFVPQMLNMDLLGGVSFSKGCYPGQEIVARMHYLGRLKRRLRLVHVAGTEVPHPGDAIVSRALSDQAAGAIVNVAPSPAGGHDALAVMPVDANPADLRLRSPDGPVPEWLELPYAVPPPKAA